MQGIRPQALSRVQSKDLADCISYCIQPPSQRPRSRVVLKHHYFDSIRAEHASVKLRAEALCLPVPSADVPHTELAEYACSAASSSVSRTSSAAGERPAALLLLLLSGLAERAATTGLALCLEYVALETFVRLCVPYV